MPYRKHGRVQRCGVCPLFAKGDEKQTGEPSSSGLTRSAVIYLLFQLDSLEFSWNMPRFTLNVDTRANVIRRTFSHWRIFLTLTSASVSSKFHKLYDSNRWLLVPETSIINIYNNAIKKKQKFPIINVRITSLASIA